MPATRPPTTRTGRYPRTPWPGPRRVRRPRRPPPSGRAPPGRAAAGPVAPAASAGTERVEAEPALTTVRGDGGDAVAKLVAERVLDVPDFPQPGVMFKDLSP